MEGVLIDITTTATTTNTTETTDTTTETTSTKVAKPDAAPALLLRPGDSLLLSQDVWFLRSLSSIAKTGPRTAGSTDKRRRVVCLVENEVKDETWYRLMLLLLLLLLTSTLVS